MDTGGEANGGIYSEKVKAVNEEKVIKEPSSSEKRRGK